MNDGLWWRTVHRLSGDVRIPFELRCHLSYLYHRRTWPGGRPVTVNEKVRWKMLKDRNPLLATFADKLAVRDYVSDRVGPEILPRLYATAADPDELDFDAFPREFVLKPSHGSRGLWIVTKHAPPGGKFPVRVWDYGITHPDATDRGQVIAAARSWLASNLGRDALEWAYLNVRPRLLVEELLRGSDGGAPTEYKLWTFHGKVRAVRFISDLYGDHQTAFYTPNWEPVEGQSHLGGRPPDRLPFPPESLDRMIEIAERLADGVDMVRVDLYDLDDRVVFGELTNYPGGAVDRWEPASFEDWLTSWWHVE